MTMTDVPVPQKPVPYQVRDLARLPEALAPLTELPRWVPWYLKWNGKKWTKPPVGSTNNPSTWRTHAAAVAANQDGIGLCFSPDWDEAGIDLDNCLREEGDLLVPKDWAKPIVKAAFEAGCYIEASVSKKGVHILGKTSRQEPLTRVVKWGEPEEGFELYVRSAGRYFTVSGAQWGQGSPLNPINPVIDELIRRWPEVQRPAHVASEPNWRVRPNQPPEQINDDLMARITGPLSEHDAADKSAAFHGVVGELLRANYSISDVVLLMDPYPDGVAQRYIAEGRLEKMVEASFNKLRAARQAEFEAAEHNRLANNPSFLREFLQSTSKPSAETAQPSPEPAPQPTDRLFQADELLKKPVPPRRWRVPGWIPQAETTLLAGDGGSGKTTLAMQLAVACATNTEWLGIKVEPCPVLYVSAEDPTGELHFRLDQIKKHLSPTASLATLHMFDLAGEPATIATFDKGKIKLTDLFGYIEQAAKQRNAGLVILDAAADFFGGNENERSEVRAFIGALRGLAMRLDAAIVIVAHPSVDGLKTGRGYSGSTHWNNGVRSRLTFTRPPEDQNPDPDARTLELSKSNRSRAGEKINMRWTAGVFGPITLGAAFNPVNDLQVEHQFLELMDRLAEQGRFVTNTPGKTYAPACFVDVPGVTIKKKEFEAAMERLFNKNLIERAAYGSPSHIRHYLRRRAGVVTTDLPTPSNAQVPTEKTQ